MCRPCFSALILVCTVSFFAYSQDGGQSKLIIEDPNKINFATDDITRFWQMVDALPTAANREDTLKLIHELYLDKASSGLKEYLDIEKKENQKDISQAYLGVLRQYPSFLKSIRGSTQKIHIYRLPAITALAKLKRIDSSVHFTDITFAIGFINTGGRHLNSGRIYIGAEILCTSEQPVLKEFPPQAIPRLRTYMAPVERVPEVVFHETIHLNKLGATSYDNLLNQTIVEGAAVFMTAFVLGEGTLTGPGGAGRDAPPYVKKYGTRLWPEFKEDMNKPAYGSETIRWAVGDSKTGLPYQTLYYLGYQICQHYYERAADKKQAIHDIIHAGNNYRQLWQGSGL